MKVLALLSIVFITANQGLVNGKYYGYQPRPQFRDQFRDEFRDRISNDLEFRDEFRYGIASDLELMDEFADENGPEFMDEFKDRYEKDPVFRETFRRRIVDNQEYMDEYMIRYEDAGCKDMFPDKCFINKCSGSWEKEYCLKTCNRCIKKHACKDEWPMSLTCVNADCKSKYFEKYCERTCGVCKVPSECKPGEPCCEDTVPYCNAYKQQICSSPDKIHRCCKTCQGYNGK